MNGIIFWTPYICMHSASVFEELGKLTNVKIACHRENYGDFGHLNMQYVQIIHINSKSDVDSLIYKTAGYIHVNNSLKATNSETILFKYALKVLLKKNEPVFAVDVEQYQWWGIKGLLRRIQWCYLYNYGIGRKIVGIGCTGETGIEAHLKAFIKRKRLFNFIYSVPTPDSYLLSDYELDYPATNESPNTVKFIYSGQIIERKNIIPLVKVFLSINKDYHLDIVGGGDLEEQLCEMIKGNSKIHYWGKLMPSQVRKILQHTDVLLQPSHLEGWGCTVNEGLMYGNRIIVSNSVGASDLIRHHSLYGQIFRSGNMQELKNSIEREIDNGPLSLESKKEIIKWATCLYPNIEARYFLEIIETYMGDTYKKPKAPWL